jgi:4-hydroxythreonine-4-phosphate dehydrogenase
MKKVAISLGDPNGIGIELALLSHTTICEFCKPIYCIDQNTLNKATK